MKNNSVVSDEIWAQLLERDEYRCLYCNSEEDLQPAHYDPRSLGGNDELDNIMLLCNTCHRMQETGRLRVKKIQDKFFFKRI